MIFFCLNNGNPIKLPPFQAIDLGTRQPVAVYRSGIVFAFFSVQLTFEEKAHVKLFDWFPFIRTFKFRVYEENIDKSEQIEIVFGNLKWK